LRAGGKLRGSVVPSRLPVSLLIVTLDNTVLNVAVPTLVRDLRAATTELQWIVDAYRPASSLPGHDQSAGERTGPGGPE
jgi:hypothetical protein